MNNYEDKTNMNIPQNKNYSFFKRNVD